MPDNDAALDLRRRARRRLIGAIALVLALVIVPPWVMDLEPKPVATNLTVEIPRQDSGGLKAAPVPAIPRAASPAKATADAPAPPAAENPPGADVPRPPDVSPHTGKAGEKPKAEPPKAAGKADSVARAEPPPENAGKDTDAKRAEAILSADAYLVPLGAFANKDNVKTLEAKLAKAGVRYYTETVTTPAGEQTRVRAGPFPSKEAAEKGRERLKTLGLSPGAVIARP
jgi:DedD protein